MRKGIPPKGSIPRKAAGSAGFDDLLKEAGNLLGSLLKGLGKTVESIKNLNLEDLEKLAEAQGNREAKERINELKKRLGGSDKKGTRISDLVGEGLDLGKLIELAVKHGGEFSKELAGGKGIIQGGIRGHVLGIPLSGGGLPLEGRVSQETKFEVRGAHSKRAPKPEKTTASEKADLGELEIDPIEEEGKYFKVRGYMAGVVEQDITCEVKDNGTVLRISATGQRKYEKEIKLPSPVIKRVSRSYKNGVLEITLTKRGQPKA